LGQVIAEREAAPISPAAVRRKDRPVLGLGQVLVSVVHDLPALEEVVRAAASGPVERNIGSSGTSESGSGINWRRAVRVPTRSNDCTVLQAFCERPERLWELSWVFSARVILDIVADLWVLSAKVILDLVAELRQHRHVAHQ
jgi:hypothetical protein